MNSAQVSRGIPSDPRPARAAEQAVGKQSFLLVRTNSCVCALPLGGVVETMRPLAVQSVQGMPPYVEGVAIIRGQTVPVVGLGSLLHGDGPASPGRFVLLRAEGRHVALAVEAVLGVFPLDPSTAQGTPPLLSEVQPELIGGIGSLDRELLLVLESSRILPAEVWSALEAHTPEKQS